VGDGVGAAVGSSVGSSVGDSVGNFVGDLDDGALEDGLFEDGLFEDGLFEDGLFEDGLLEDFGRLPFDISSKILLSRLSTRSDIPYGTFTILCLGSASSSALDRVSAVRRQR